MFRTTIVVAYKERSHRQKEKGKDSLEAKRILVFCFCLTPPSLSLSPTSTSRTILPTSTWSHSSDETSPASQPKEFIEKKNNKNCSVGYIVKEATRDVPNHQPRKKTHPVLNKQHRVRQSLSKRGKTRAVIGNAPSRVW